VAALSHERARPPREEDATRVAGSGTEFEASLPTLISSFSPLRPADDERAADETMTKNPGARSRHRKIFWRRMLLHSAIALGVIGVSLAIGIWGYEHYEHLLWRDAFLNAAMILGGMGPVKTDFSEPGKIFAGLYALYSGLVVVAVAGLLLSPGIHHLMHHVDWDDEPERT
jgi:hypothetical protein